MDPRTNGHADNNGSSAEPEPPRLTTRGQPQRSNSADSLRAADQLTRLEARIRDFHHNLDSLDTAEADVDRLSRRTADTGAAADNLVSRAAAAARLAADGGQTAGPEVGQRRRRSDGRAEGPFTAQRRIDALRPEAGTPTRETATDTPPASWAPAAPWAPAPPDPAAEARAVAETIRLEAERRAERLHRDAAREATAIRQEAEQEMQELWQALEIEVAAIQTEISQRVDSLAGRMEAVSREAELMHSQATEEADRTRAKALAEATQTRRAAAEDAEGLLALAEREAHALIADARSQADALITRAQAQAEAIASEAAYPGPAAARLTEPHEPSADPVAAPAAPPAAEPAVASAGEPAVAPERHAAERIAEQIRDATAALTRRVSRAVEDPPSVAREVCGNSVVPGSVRDVLDGLGAAVALIERSLAGLAELLGDTLGGSDPVDDA